ncbi:hypothetical protein T439DRAFT_69957 [Meredithblackwellia eburnea MCA 4105]
MSGKVGAYGTTAKTSDTSFRKEWNQEEYAERARAKDKEAHDRAVEAEEYAKQGKRPPRKKDDLPKPTELMKAREGPLELDKNLNKTMIVSGSKGTGYFCDVCQRTCKDSVAYLDHINGRTHLRRLGQTTKVVRSTLDDVRAKIAELRAKTAESSESKKYDFNQRIKEIKDLERANREQMKEERKRKRQAGKEKKAAAKGMEEQPVDDEMMAMMGFGGFGVKAK